MMSSLRYVNHERDSVKEPENNKLLNVLRLGLIALFCPMFVKMCHFIHYKSILVAFEPTAFQFTSPDLLDL